jgi:hypothetical protein
MGFERPWVSRLEKSGEDGLTLQRVAPIMQLRENRRKSERGVAGGTKSPQIDINRHRTRYTEGCVVRNPWWARSEARDNVDSFDTECRPGTGPG